MCLAIRKGFPLSEPLSNRSPGKLCESRWLTKTIRIMRLYVSTLNSTDSSKVFPLNFFLTLMNFKNYLFAFRLAFIVTYVYAPSWFHNKCYAKLQDAPRNFHNLIKLSSILRLKENFID
jgi:hypothetical protein